MILTEKITVLVVEPEKAPYIKEIDHNLESLQSEVSGRIEVCPAYDDDVCFICNEEGKNIGLRLNRALMDEDGKISDIIAGTFLVAGLTEDSFGSLSDEFIIKYCEMFKPVQFFLMQNEKLCVLNYHKDYKDYKDYKKHSIQEQVARFKERTQKKQGDQAKQKPYQLSQEI